MSIYPAFSPVNLEELSRLLNKSYTSTCAPDTIPSCLYKNFVSVILLSFLCHRHSLAQWNINISHLKSPLTVHFCLQQPPHFLVDENRSPCLYSLSSMILLLFSLESVQIGFCPYHFTEIEKSPKVFMLLNKMVSSQKSFYNFFNTISQRPTVYLLETHSSPSKTPR